MELNNSIVKGAQNLCLYNVYATYVSLLPSVPAKNYFLRSAVLLLVQKNQQRCRRFRAAQEARERKEMLAEVLEDMQREGFDTSEQGKISDHDRDCNVIGIEFMTKISLFIKFRQIMGEFDRHFLRCLRTW